MLTRLQVTGFKNLVDVDVRFGPFTCVAGANGTGKSNLFDAIRFLSLLADKSLLEAARSIRDEQGKSADVRNLFHRAGKGRDRFDTQMSFAAEMIIPAEGRDELGQPVTATTTFVRYELVIGFRGGNSSPGPLEILKEELAQIRLADAPHALLFPHSAKRWRDSLMRGQRRKTPYFISTEGEGASRVINLHQDRGGRGMRRGVPAADLPRTILSVVNAADDPTALLARNGMRSWRLLQLEPSSLRRPDGLDAPTTLGSDGSHLAATLYRLARMAQPDRTGEPEAATSSTYARVANRLWELVDDIRDVYVDRDEKRGLLTLMATGRDGTSHPALALSDGTLRFLALAALEEDPTATGLICLEEPENGIHPERIPAMLRLLRDIAMDAEEPVGPDNPLRQVIINTHSPAVVGQVDRDGLVVAQLVETLRGGKRFKRAHFSAMPGTWRCENGAEAVPLGHLLAYLNPILPPDQEESDALPKARARKLRVVDCPDLQRYLAFPQSSPS